MRAWSRESIDLRMSKREAERLLGWVESNCTEDPRDRPGVYLARAIRDGLDGVRFPPAASQPPERTAANPDDGD